MGYFPGEPDFAEMTPGELRAELEAVRIERRRGWEIHAAVLEEHLARPRACRWRDVWRKGVGTRRPYLPKN